MGKPGGAGGVGPGRASLVRSVSVQPEKSVSVPKSSVPRSSVPRSTSEVSTKSGTKSEGTAKSREDAIRRQSSSLESGKPTSPEMDRRSSSPSFPTFKSLSPPPVRFSDIFHPLIRAPPNSESISDPVLDLKRKGAYAVTPEDVLNRLLNRQEKPNRQIVRLLEVEAYERARYEMDTCRAWTVLAAGFFTYFIQMGFITSFGIYADIIAREFHATQAQAGFAGGCAIGIAATTSLVGAMVYKMVGVRVLVTIAGTWVILGFVSASYAQSLNQLYGSICSIGLGFGWNMIAICSVQVDYFQRFRLFALAFESVGAAVGTTLMPQIIVALSDNYGWRSSLFVLGGASSSFYIVAAVMASRHPKNFSASFSAIIQFNLLKRKTLLVCCLNCFLWGGASYSFFFFEARYVKRLNMGSHVAATVVTVLGISNIVGRLTSSFLSQREATNRLLLNASSCFLWSSFVVAFSFAASPVLLAVTAAGFGLGYGLMFPSLSPALLELFGADLIATSQGLSWFCMGLGSLSMPWLVGILADSISFPVAYYFIAFCGFSASALIFGLAWFGDPGGSENGAEYA